MSADDLNYEHVERKTREELLRLFDSDDPPSIAAALYSAAYHDSDWKWVQSQCLRCLTSPDLRVRWAAATCLGDLSVFHHKLDLELVIPALKQALNDPSIRSTVDDSLEQIHQNVKTQ
jgi:HEAT repeat protein